MPLRRSSRILAVSDTLAAEVLQWRSSELNAAADRAAAAATSSSSNRRPRSSSPPPAGAGGSKQKRPREAAGAGGGAAPSSAGAGAGATSSSAQPRGRQRRDLHLQQGRRRAGASETDRAGSLPDAVKAAVDRAAARLQQSGVPKVSLQLRTPPVGTQLAVLEEFTKDNVAEAKDFQDTQNALGATGQATGFYTVNARTHVLRWLTLEGLTRMMDEGVRVLRSGLMFILHYPVAASGMHRRNDGSDAVCATMLTVENCLRPSITAMARSTDQGDAIIIADDRGARTR